MTKKRFILLIAFILLLTTWGIIFGGNPFILFVDIPSLIFVPILPYVIASFIYPFGEQRRFNREIFKEVGTGNKLELERAIAFYKLIKRLVIVATILASLIGFIGILSNLEDLDSIGKNFGVLSVTVFYASVYILAIVEPLKGIAQKNLIG